MEAPRPAGMAKAHNEVRSYSTAKAMKMPPNVCKKVFSLSGKLPNETSVTQKASIAE